MNRIIAFFLIGLFLAACTSNTIYKKPKDLIPKEQMVDLLTDMYLATAAKSVKAEEIKRNMSFMPLVYEKYAIDSVQFQASNIYYMSLIDDYEDMMKSVEKRLRFMLDTTNAAKKIKDSLKKLNKPKKKKPHKFPVNTKKEAIKKQKQKSLEQE